MLQEQLVAFAQRSAEAARAEEAAKQKKTIPLDAAQKFIDTLGEPYEVDYGQFCGGYQMMLYEHPEDSSRHVRVELDPDGNILACETWVVVRGNLR